MNNLCAPDSFLEFIIAGASAVQIGTATFSNPEAAVDILGGIEAFMKEKGIEKISEIKGTLVTG